MFKFNICVSFIYHCCTFVENVILIIQLFYVFLDDIFTKFR